MLLHTHAHARKYIQYTRGISYRRERKIFRNFGAGRNSKWTHDPVRAAVYPFGDPRSVTGALYSLRLVVGAVVEAGPGHLGGCILDGSTDENQLGKLTGEKRGRELFPPERALTPCSHSGENVSRIHECQRESRIRNGRRSNGQKTFCSLR